MKPSTCTNTCAQYAPLLVVLYTKVAAGEPVTSAVVASIPQMLYRAIGFGVGTESHVEPLLVVLSTFPEAPQAHTILLSTAETEYNNVVTGEVCSDHCEYV